MPIELLKAMLTGMVTALPVGPILFMVIQKTLGESRRAGLFVGLGSAIADTIWAALGLFALGLVAEFIKKNGPVIMIVGGLLVIGIGVMMFVRKPKMQQEEKDTANHTGNVFRAVLCAMSNPGAFAVMMAMLAAMGLGAGVMKSPVWLVLICVFVGEMIYWTVLTYFLMKAVRIKPETVLRMSKVTGALVSVFGVVLMVRGIITCF